MNKKQAVFILIVPALIFVGYFLFKSKLNPEKMDDSKNSTQVEYKDKDVGFSFEYDKSLGDIVVTRNNDGDMGQGFNNSIGKPGEYFFSFNFYSNDWIIGDSIMNEQEAWSQWNEDFKNNKLCEHKDYAECSQVVSDSGVPVLFYKNSVRSKYEPYYLEFKLPNTSSYAGVIFTSKNKQSLLDIVNGIKFVE